MASLKLEEVTKIYRRRRQPPVRAVDRLSMEIADGEIVALLGSSGCGKTSSLRMIAGFESVTEGAILIGERPVHRLPPAQRGVAMAFEAYALYPPLRVADNIGFSLLRERHPRQEIERQVRAIAEMLEIEDILERYPPNISAGQQQRVSLARALVRRAAVHLLDEPMSQLEPQLRAVLRTRIKEFLIERSLTTVFVTHDQNEAVALADRVAVMEQGVLQQFGTPAELKNRPANLFVASFIGEPAMNLFPARLFRAEGRIGLAVENEAGQEAFRLELPPLAPEAQSLERELREGRTLHLGLRPHRIVVGAPQGEMPRLKGRLISNQWLGDQSHLGVLVDDCLLFVVTDRSLDLPLESEVTLGLPPACLHLFDSESGKALAHGLQPAGGGV